MKKATLQLETLTCPSCLQKIENGVGSLDGVDTDTLKVMFNASKVKVNFDEDIISIEEIEQVIENLGYAVEKSRVKSA